MNAQILSARINDRIMHYYQGKIDKLYFLFWNVYPMKEQETEYSRLSMRKFENSLQKNKDWFLAYLSSNWSQYMDIYQMQRTTQVIAAYLLYDKSLHPLEKLHFAKYYCNGMITNWDLVDQRVLTVIAGQSYLQNSLYESGKMSYIKK